MALTKDMKKETISKFGINSQDTGSTQLQIALLTNRIRIVTEHLKKFQHDFSSKQGLLKMVAKRRKYLRYLQETDPKAYTSLIEKLELKK